jgi:hypothetical protein
MCWKLKKELQPFLNISLVFQPMQHCATALFYHGGFFLSFFSTFLLKNSSSTLKKNREEVQITYKSGDEKRVSPVYHLYHFSRRPTATQDAKEKDGARFYIDGAWITAFLDSQAFLNSQKDQDGSAKKGLTKDQQRAIRFLKEWAMRRGVFSSQLGLIDGFIITELVRNLNGSSTLAMRRILHHFILDYKQDNAVWKRLADGMSFCARKFLQFELSQINSTLIGNSIQKQDDSVWSSMLDTPRQFPKASPILYFMATFRGSDRGTSSSREWSFKVRAQASHYVDWVIKAGMVKNIVIVSNREGKIIEDHHSQEINNTFAIIYQCHPGKKLTRESISSLFLPLMRYAEEGLMVYESEQELQSQKQELQSQKQELQKQELQLQKQEKKDGSRSSTSNNSRPPAPIDPPFVPHVKAVDVVNTSTTTHAVKKQRAPVVMPRPIREPAPATIATNSSIATVSIAPMSIKPTVPIAPIAIPIKPSAPMPPLQSIAPIPKKSSSTANSKLLDSDRQDPDMPLHKSKPVQDTRGHHPLYGPPPIAPSSAPSRARSRSRSRSRSRRSNHERERRRSRSRSNHRRSRHSDDYGGSAERFVCLCLSVFESVL